MSTCRRQHETFDQPSTTEALQRTEYIARFTYYDKTGKRQGISKSAPTSGDAKRELQELINRHVEGGAECWIHVGLHSPIWPSTARGLVIVKRSTMSKVVNFTEYVSQRSSPR